MFRVGPAEVVYGPNKYTDSFLTGIRINDNLVRAYIANNETVLLEGTSVADLEPTIASFPIDKGPAESFDECGAWLQGVYADPDNASVLHAWYHAEENCNYEEGQARASTAYARSTGADATRGKSFTKVDYSDNQVVTSPDPEEPTKHTGRGGATVIIRNGYYYMYLKNTETKNAIVARAPISSDGLPGTWKMYNDVGGTETWTEPGLLGITTELEFATGYHVPGEPTKTKVPGASSSRYTPDNSVVLVKHFENEGVILMNSTDGVTDWIPLEEKPLIPLGDQRPFGEDEPEEYVGYPSIVNFHGARAWGDTFYLFYLYIQPGVPWKDNRLLVRRRVTVTTDDGSRPGSIIALAKWGGNAKDRWDTASVVDATYPESPGTTHGYLPTTQLMNTAPLYDCVTSGGDHFPAQNCSTSTSLRMTGYIWTSSSAYPGTVPLYRCKTASNDNFVTTDAVCEGHTVRWIAGWVLPKTTL